VEVGRRLDWTRLKWKLPRDFHRLCDIGKEYEKVKWRMLKSPVMTVVHYDEFKKAVRLFFTEYLLLLGKFYTKKEDIEKIKEDIRSALPMVYPRHDRKYAEIRALLLDLTHRKTGPWLAEVFVAEADDLIAQVYNNLLKALEESYKTLRLEFVKNSIVSAGMTIKPTAIKVEAGEAEK